MIVDDDCHVIGREAIRLEDHLIVWPRGLHLAADQVGESERHVVWDEHPHHGILTEPRQRSAFLAGLAVAEAVVASFGNLGGLLSGTHLGEALS